MKTQVISASIIEDGIVWNRTNSHSLQLLTKKQIMDLQTAKTKIKEVSKADKKTTYYLNVDDDGEVEISKKYSPDATGFAYVNGGEVALPIEQREVSAIVKDTTGKDRKVTVQKGTINSKQTAAADSAETMKNKTTKPAVKKSVSPSSKAPKAAATITGDKKTLTVKAILALQKKGTRVYRQANPTPGGILIEKRLKGYANQEKTIDVIVAKAAK